MGGEAFDGDAGDAVGVLVLAVDDVVADLAEGVDGGVEEAELGLAGGGALGGDQGQDASEGGGGGGGAGDELEAAVDVDVEVGAEGGDVGVGAAGGVVVGGLGELAVGAEVVGDGGLLVGGAGEGVGEAAAGPGDGVLDVLHRVGVGGADGGDVGRGGGPGGRELGALEDLAADADAGVAGGGEEGDAEEAGLAERVVVGVHGGGLAGGGVVVVAEAPGDGDDGGDGGAGEERRDPGGEVEVAGLVVVGAALGPEDGLGVVEDRADVLEVEGALDLVGVAGGVGAHDLDVVGGEVVLGGEGGVGGGDEVLVLELADGADDGGVEVGEGGRGGDLVSVVDGDGGLGHAGEADVLGLELLLEGFGALGAGELGAVGDGGADELADLEGELVGVLDADGLGGGADEGAVDGGVHLHRGLDALVEGAGEDVVGLGLVDLAAAHLGLEVVAGLGEDGAGCGVELLELVLGQVLAVAGVAGGGDVPEGLVDLGLGVGALEVEDDLVDVVVAGELEVVSSGGHAEEEHGEGGKKGSGDGNGSESRVEDAHFGLL